MKLTGETKVLLGILVVTAVVIGLAAIVLTKPAPTFSREELLPSTAHTKGNAGAKTYLVEFSDFQCPACLAVKPIVDDVIKTHGNSLVFSYRHFPLTQHPFGQKAAVAAEAAGNQGKFWEAYDVLFTNQKDLSDEFLTSELPRLLQIDPTKYAKDSADATISALVDNDQSAGTRFGVNATPTFFLNGRKLELSSFEDLTRAVSQAVANNQ